jgi:hypothetical protein
LKGTATEDETTEWQEQPTSIHFCNFPGQLERGATYLDLCLLIRQAVDQHIDALPKVVHAWTIFSSEQISRRFTSRLGLQVFVQILRGIPRIARVVGAKQKHVYEIIAMLKELQQELVNQKVPTVLKIMVLTYADSDVDGESFSPSAITVLMND